ncbi:methylcytosine dioxygenase TET2 [Gouania willdenowi]|uniref:Methylcytosine dioxygenase TET n=1 Tax=Gouania willdenowi TaxID=441366 RepID=A0A8C5GI26_GOUWI|nr:methylcytosine dioxygenase TET2 [Gouania willdenowi]
METEQTKHETEESLILSQFGSSHISHKLQNGNQTSDADQLKLSGDTIWNHYKPSAGANSVKRPHDDCKNSVSDLDQGLFDHGPYMINGQSINGDVKHAFTEQSLFSHQSKKIKLNSEIKGRHDIDSALAEHFPELTKATEFECQSPHTEMKFSNGDVFSPPHNKQLLNGTASPHSTIESTPDDRFEKTLSQYYPEKVSVVPQHFGAFKDSLTKKLSTDGAQLPPMTSGLLNSVQMHESQKYHPLAAGNTDRRNNYNNVVNGYIDNFRTDHQQQQHQQQSLSYASPELARGHLPNLNPLMNTANNTQQPNGAKCYSDETNHHGILENTHMEGNRSSFLVCGNPSKIPEMHEYGSFSESAIQKMGPSEKLGCDQNIYHGSVKGLPYEIQQQNKNSRDVLRSDSTGPTGPIFPKILNTELDNRMKNSSQDRDNVPCSTPAQTAWMALNSSHSQQQHASGTSAQAQQHDIWGKFHTKSQADDHMGNHLGHGEILEQNREHRFQTQGVCTENKRSNNYQIKEEGCQSSQPHCVQQALHLKTPEQQKYPQTPQKESCYPSQMKTEYLNEDTDLQNILSSEFLASHQSQQQHCNLPRPLSHPPQFESHQLKSPNYRPHSQPHPGQQQLQSIQSLINNSGQNVNQHIQQSDHTTEMQHQSRSLTNSSKSSQFHQQPNNNFHQPNHLDLPQTSTQLPFSQNALHQPVSMQMQLKAEHQLKTSCAQFQRGPQLPHVPGGPYVDFQKHAALRMHLLQKQERQGHPNPSQRSNDPKHMPQAVKIENGHRFVQCGSQQQQEQLLMRETSMGVEVKQEDEQSLCEESRKQRSILASMEQTLRQYQLSPVFEKKSHFISSSNKVKVESSGPVTILSTHVDVSGAEALMTTSSSSALKKTPETTPKKELLQSFMDSPMKLLDTPIRNLLDTPMKTQYDIASCHCVEQISEKDEGPYYTHLGSAPNVAGIREKMEKRSGLSGHAIRIEKVMYTGKEGKSTQGCPIAKWVIRRSSVEEKLLVLVRERNGHKCESACIIVVIMVWEGIPSSLADCLYLELSDTLTKHGAHTQRRCALNEERTCACQGLNPEASGASFSFGCSWSMYYNGCKFARSKVPRKFKLLGDDVKEEERIEHRFQNLATLLAPLYKKVAPEAYGNQVEHEHRAPDCRLGLKEGRPFSGVTACMDFCAHAHRDLHNMIGGSTVVCTLTREDNREIGKIPEDEQLHVLPLYKASNTDEFGSEEGQQEKIRSGAIQVLSAFRRQVRMLAEPAKSCRQKKLDAKKAAANKNAMLDSANEKALLAKSKASTYDNIAQLTPVTGPGGAKGAILQSSQTNHLFGSYPQQQQHLASYSGAPNSALTRFPNQPGFFPSTSKPGSMYSPQPPTSGSTYPSPLHAPNPYMNGSNRPYPGYQCNGGMPLDNCHPYYASNTKHLDMYRQQRPALYPEQQYGGHRYEVNYPRYGEQGLHVNGYNVSSIRPVHPMSPYGPYGPNRTPDPQYMDPLLGVPSTHGGLDYATAVSKGNPFGRYPNPYLSQSPQSLPPGQDGFHMQIKTEMGTLGQHVLSSGGFHPDKQPGLGLPNGNPVGSNIKQEPGTPGTPQTPTTPQKPETWSDNEHNFLDPDIGGVAVAPSHGSVLIECAKRELHATTPLKNPDRQHPTRISLVFYQHKNLNEAKHGLVLWEAKMAEKAREKEEAERNGVETTPTKSNKKGAKSEHLETSASMGEPPYKRFIQKLLEGSLSCATNTYVSTSPYAFTKVTGPYSKFV